MNCVEFEDLGAQGGSSIDLCELMSGEMVWLLSAEIGVEGGRPPPVGETPKYTELS